VDLADKRGVNAKETEMGATHTTERIEKLLAKGLAPESIARKIGRPGAEGVERVKAEIERLAKKTQGADQADR
jgi:hypothetical protein